MTQNVDHKFQKTNLEGLNSKPNRFNDSETENLDDSVKMNQSSAGTLEDLDRHTKSRTKLLRLKELLSKLSNLITARIQLTKEIESKQYALQKLYINHKDSYFPSKLKDSINGEHAEQKLMVNEIEHIKKERDRAVGLVKVLLATLKSSRMQYEENFQKLKYSSDLMFHILYKAEDAFLSGEEKSQ